MINEERGELGQLIPRVRRLAYHLLVIILIGLGAIIASMTGSLSWLTAAIIEVVLFLTVALHGLIIGVQQLEDSAKTATQKQKRSDRLALSDDGELVTLDDYAPEQHSKCWWKYILRLSAYKPLMGGTRYVMYNRFVKK